MDFFEILSNWLEQTKESIDLNKSFQEIMTAIAIKDALWLKEGQDQLYIYCYSKDSPHKSLVSLDGLTLTKKKIASNIEYFGSDYYLNYFLKALYLTIEHPKTFVYIFIVKF